MKSVHHGMGLFRHGRRSKAILSGSLAASVVIGLLPLAMGPLAPVTAGATSDHLVFTTQPGDGNPNVALATQPVVTIEDNSNATVDTSSSVSLTLTGPGGAALSGVHGNLTCTATSVAASHGVATFAGCKVDRGGIYTLTANDATDSISVVSASFFVSGPAQLAFTGQPGGGSGGITWANQPQVTVEDANGVAVSASTAHISLAIVSGTGSGGALLSCTTNPVTASSGVSTFAGCKIDKLGTGYELVATDATDALQSPASDAFDIATGDPDHLVFTTQPSGSSGGIAFGLQPVVAVKDAGNNTIAGNTDSISLSIHDGGNPSGALTCTTNPMAASSGVATFGGCKIDLASPAGTPYHLQAADSTHSLSVLSGPVPIAAGPAAHIAFSMQPSGGSASTAFGTQPVVHLTDAGGNPVPGAVALSIKTGTGASGAVLGCVTNPLSTNASGDAAFNGCNITLTHTNYQLTATSGALSADSNAFDISGAGAVAHLSFSTQPGGGTGGTAWSAGHQPVVALTDTGGNPTTGAVTLTISDGTGAPDAALHCTTNPVNSAGGSATFAGCRIDKAGEGYTLTATSGTIHATSDPFDITTGSAAMLAFVAQPGPGTGGLPWANQPVVQVQDAGGNQVITSTATVSLSITSGSGAGALSCSANTLPAVHGSAQFSNCAIDKTGSAYTLTAHASGLSDGVSDPFAITVGAPAQLVFSTQPGGGPAGIAWATQPAVTVADAGGNTVTSSSASIALSIAAGSGTSPSNLGCDSNPLAASSGVAAYTGCSIDTAAGGYALIANDSADSLSAESLPFSILVPPPGPLGLAPQGVPLAQTFGNHTYGANPTAVEDDVNTATGSLTFSSTDLNVAGIGEPLSVIRTYNSADTTSGSFGPGWTSLLDVGVNVVKNQTATVRGEDGQQLVWTWNAVTSTWMPPPGAQETLQCGAKQCKVTRNDGVMWDVNLTANGQKEILDYLAPDGQGLTFAWGAGSVVITVASSNATPYRVTVTLDGSGHVTRIQTPNSSVPGSNRNVQYTYGSGGVLTSVRDVRGNTWNYGYNAANLLTTITDPLGHVRQTATYDANGRVTAVSSKGGPQHTDDIFSWDAGTQTSTRGALINAGGTPVRANTLDQYLGNVLVRQTLPSGAITRFSYDAQLNLIAAQDPLGWVTQFTYDAANNLIGQSRPITSTTSATTSMTYDNQHRLLTQTDADGNTTRYIYNGPYVGLVRAPNIQSGTAFTYNKLGELVEVDGDLGKQLYQYDAMGNRTVLLQQTLAGAALNGKGSLMTYDEAGDLLTSADPRGTTPNTANLNSYKVTRTYDAAGHLLTSTNPGGGATSSTAYDTAGDVHSTTDQLGHTTTYSWDEPTLTRTATTGANPSTSQVYDASGDLLTENLPGNRSITHVFDTAGREIRTTDASNVTVETTYDIEGNVVAVRDSTGQTLLRDYDSLNRLIRQNSDGQVTLTGYDPAGNVTSQTDPNGSVTTTTWDAYGKVSSVHDANGTTSYSYDAAGNVVSRTDPNGHVTGYAYDAASRQTSMTVNGATTAYTYDVAGNVTKVVDAAGRSTTFTLDALNHATSIVNAWAGHGSNVTVTQAFDALGRRTSMTDGTGTHAYVYDANGNMTSAGTPFGTFAYSYSDPGKIHETYPDGTAVTYATDDVGNLMGVSSGTQGSPDYVSASYIRNPARQTTGVAYGNGVLETRKVDLLGDVLQQTLQLGATTLADNAFSYDAAQNRLSQADDVLGNVTTNHYNYSTTGRLTAFNTSSGVSTHTSSAPPPPLSTPVGGTPGVAPFAGTGNAQPFSPQAATPITPTYAYDGVGNITNNNGTTTTYDASDRAAGYTYDAAGNVLSGGGKSYTYDAAGHVVSVTTSSGTVTYTYDGDGNRLSRNSAGNVTQYVWDPAGSYPRLAIERTGDASHTLIHRYINGEGPVAMQTPAATYYMHLDPQGTVAELTDSTGAVAAAYHYDGYGNVLSTDGASPPSNPMLFQGQLLDQGTGLYDMRARNYDPATGRFTQRDPVQIPVGTPVVAPFAFVGDQPTRFTDPTGMVALPTATSIFWGHDSLGANITTDIKYGVTAIKLGFKATLKGAEYLATRAANKVAGIIDRISGNVGSATGEVTGLAEDAGRAELRAAGSELESAAETAGSLGKASKFLGPALEIVGIGLQTYITVEDCMHGPVAQCVGEALGTAISIGFFVGCTIATEGVGAAVCGVVGAILSVAVSEIVTRYGPVIADGVVSLYHDAVNGIESVLPDITHAAVDYYNHVVGGINTALGAISTGINKATAAIASGFNTAINTLVEAGYTARELGHVLATAFNEGLKDTVAALINFGYHLEDVANTILNEFSATAQQAAQLFKDAFNYTVQQIAGVLKDVYNLADEAAATILKGINFAVDEVGKALKDVYLDAAAAVGTVLKDIGYAINQIGSVLKHVYAEIDSAVASALKTLGYLVDQVGQALVDLYNDIDSAVASALQFATFAVNEIATALKDVFNDAAQAMAGILKTLSYTIDQVAGALKDVYNLLHQAAAQILENVLFTINQVASALKDVFNDIDTAVATVLRSIGNTVDQIATAVSVAFTEAAQVVANVLKTVGFVVSEVATALKDVFSQVAQDAAQILKNIGYVATEVAAALQGVFTQLAQDAAQILKNIGYAIDAIAGALQTIFGEAAEAAANILKAIGYAASEIANALVDIFNQVANEVGQILKDIGEAASDIANVLENAFGEAATDIANFLSSIGFNSSTIDAIGGAFASFGQSVADCFTSFFSDC